MSFRFVSLFCKRSHSAIAMSPVPSVKIPGGAEFPMVGLGTWKSKQGANLNSNSN